MRLVEIAHADPEVVDRPLAGADTAVGHGLDAVPVGVEQEGAVVVRGVLRPCARLAVAVVAGVHAAPPERVDLLPRRRDERDVQVARRSSLVRRREREVAPVGTEQRRVEATARLEVRSPDGDAVEHP
jgi:hypothetical protein